MHKVRSIIDSAIVSIGNLSSSIIGAVFWLVLASIVNVDEYGVLAFYFSLAAIASAASLFGLGSTIMAYLPKGSQAIVGQASIIVLITSSLASIVIAVVFNNLAAALLVLAANAFSLSVSEHLAKKCYKRYSIVSIINRGSQFAISLVLYYLMGINGVIIGYALPSLAIGYRLFLSIKESGFSLAEITPKLKFSLHVCINAISLSIATYGDKLIITPLFGLSILGIYNLGFQFFMFLSVIPGSLYQYLLPQEASGVDSKVIRKSGLILAIILAVVFYGLSPNLISWFFPRYIDAIPVARIMVFGVIPQTITSMTNARLLGREKSSPVVIGATVYVTSLLVLLYSLGSSYGLTGLAFSVLISLSLQSCTLLILNRGQDKRWKYQGV